MIYECSNKHLCFSKDELGICGMTGCSKQTVKINNENINWFYRINKNGLCISRDSLHMIIEDPNMPNAVKAKVRKIFFSDI
jgi:hypothetical protein